MANKAKHLDTISAIDRTIFFFIVGTCKNNRGNKAMGSDTDVHLLRCQKEGDQTGNGFVCVSNSLFRRNSGHIDGKLSEGG